MLKQNKTEHVITHDIGTTGSKTCLFQVGDKIELLEETLHEYPVEILSNGGVEQNPEHWWEAICNSTAKIMQTTTISPNSIKGISFCTQMQAYIPVDEQGQALRHAMSYMDQRAESQLHKGMMSGFLKFSGFNVRKLLKFIRITGIAPLSVKDPIWKYLWVKEREPSTHARTHKWYDVKEYLLHKCTGVSAMTLDSAFSTVMLDSRKGQLNWSQELFDLVGADINHMPKLIESTDQAGLLSEEAAAAMQLPAGIPVFGGGGDAALIPIGAGCTQPEDTHIYVGTSGWVSTVTEKRTLDVNSLVASTVGAIPGHYNFLGIHETSGICLKWVRDHLALDEIGIFLEKQHVAEKHEEYSSLFDYMSKVVTETEPGAGGVIFTPWLRGNRCPFDDPNTRGMFFNIGLDTGKRMLIRSVLEGVAYQKRWMLESIQNKLPTSETIRFVGGGANSEVWCQIMADVTGYSIEVPASPQNAGAVGAAAICAVGLGIMTSYEDVKTMIPAKKVFHPRLQYKEMYDRQFAVFKTLYNNNKNAFAKLNQVEEIADSAFDGVFQN